MQQGGRAACRSACFRDWKTREMLKTDSTRRRESNIDHRARDKRGIAPIWWTGITILTEMTYAVSCWVVESEQHGLLIAGVDFVGLGRWEGAERNSPKFGSLIMHQRLASQIAKALDLHDAKTSLHVARPSICCYLATMRAPFSDRSQKDSGSASGDAGRTKSSGESYSFHTAR